MTAIGTGDLIARALQKAGTRNIFTINGGHIWGILMGAQEIEINLVGVRHEQTAAFAAEGWSKLTRECGVCAVTAGPGVTNTISAIANAAGSDTPLLVLGGRSPLSTAGTGSLQELDHLPLLNTLTKYAHTADSAADAQRSLGEALALATSGRPGPTFVDFPTDVFFDSAEDLSRTAIAPPTLPEADPEEVAKAASLIDKAARPCAVVGSGVWLAGAETELVELLTKAGIPAVLNGQARGLLPPGHPLLATRGRRVALGEADLVIAIGVPLDFRLGFGRPPVIDAQAKLVYVDFDDRRRHRPGDAAVDGDIGRSLRDIAERLQGSRQEAGWRSRIAEAVAASARSDAELEASNASPIHPARVVAEVRRRLDPDAIVIGDGGDFVSFVGRLLDSPQPGCFLDPGPYGCLGTGAGYAMAARLAYPSRQVVIFNGDGAFGFSAMDFETLVRERLPVVAVIGNNGIWATEKHQMESMLGTAIAADLRPGVRYDLMIEALGGHGELVEDAEQIGPAFERALKSGVPAVVNVLTDPEARYPRSVAMI
jgi:acetolactate synthase-1/2/3 large subunit